MINVVLLEPRIPQNTGNIGRLCLATNSKLHLIHPLGFILDDRGLKRAGMDYFKDINLIQWDSLSLFLQSNKIADNHFFLSTKAQKNYFDAKFCDECFLYFGREDRGLPEELIKSNFSQVFKIPMFNNARSLNLSNSVSIVVYEAIRQIKYS
ncbi:tRNA (cytidine(34)-2'-O)-methyltransferase [Helicobacter sp. MIT 14-3879]|uniref:tRNA (cytidine(34)-2'-O)-methyltransferase n=1 Tax=Helicobacter sp. MIT 14-3879 TaxID=2040649 RepID=UPI000E1EFB63|nr:tRNA (cytidine(34)-2'-O)-methyltransferase [Helicobacter sp. MIT 14-3879]RDU65552.1 tRNA (cytidine(34)-2'-O)-methyltransferase [Helicobacter sp. MIT 14-3879]